MSTLWKIGLSTASYTDATLFSAAGLSNLRRTLHSAQSDQVTFTFTSQAALTDASAFDYGATYIVWRKDGTSDPVRWFVGACNTIPRQGSSKSETLTITLIGPWWYFEAISYQQVWKAWSLTEAELQDITKPRVVLGQSAAGARLDSGAQVADVIDWLILRGVPIAKGVIDTGATFPYDERNNVKCSEVVDAMMRYLPDWIAWFDYTTVPNPTFHFRKRSNLTPVSISTAGAPLSELQITPRYDLQKPGVKLIYEKTVSIDQLTYNIVETDTAGDTADYEAIIACFDLQGPTTTFLKQKVEVADMPTDAWSAANKKAWIKLHAPWTNKIADGDFGAIALTFEPAGDHEANILVKGQIQDWMEDASFDPLIVEDLTLIFTFDYLYKDANAVPRLSELIDLKITVKATNAETKTYSVLDSFDSGEETPTGVAAALFSAWNTLHFDGGFRLVESECSGTVFPGRTLNLTDGIAAWATMAALVQEVSEDIDTGHTSVTFGPPRAIEADSLVALFRALRGRSYSMHRLEKTTGETSGAGATELSGVVCKNEVSLHPSDKKLDVIKADIEE